jgi:hypothetical protein
MFCPHEKNVVCAYLDTPLSLTPDVCSGCQHAPAQIDPEPTFPEGRMFVVIITLAIIVAFFFLLKMAIVYFRPQ